MSSLGFEDLLRISKIIWSAFLSVPSEPRRQLAADSWCRTGMGASGWLQGCALGLHQICMHLRPSTLHRIDLGLSSLPSRLCTGQGQPICTGSTRLHRLNPNPSDCTQDQFGSPSLSPRLCTALLARHRFICPLDCLLSHLGTLSTATQAHLSCIYQ